MSNELEIIEIKTVGEYVEKIHEFEHRHIAQWFFRGHSDSSYKLVPSLYRLSLDGSFASYDDLERYMTDAFQRESVAHLDFTPVNNLEWLAIAQHYGLPTRLLDWTSNPLIGLYFAVEVAPQREADVWCMGIPSTNNCLPESTHFAQRITLAKSNLLYFPRHVFDRAINQAGCFTVHKSEVPLEEANEFLLNIFIKIKIAATHKAAILNELFMLGIHRGFIYPGLEGIAKRLHFEVTAKHPRHTTELLSKLKLGLEDRRIPAESQRGQEPFSTSKRRSAKGVRKGKSAKGGRNRASLDSHGGETR